MSGTDGSGRAQQRGHFFLNVDDDFGLTQFFLQAQILPPQLLVLRRQGVAFRFRSALSGKDAVNGGVALLPPTCQGRGIDPFAPENLADAAAPAAASTSARIFFLYEALKLRRLPSASLPDPGKPAQGTNCLTVDHDSFPSRPAL